MEFKGFLTLKFATYTQKIYHNYIIYYTENVSLIFWKLYGHIIIIKLDFSMYRKLYLMEMLMIKSEETKLLDLVVYREYSREITDCCLPCLIDCVGV